MGEPHKPQINHSLLEDAQAFLLGTALCALGLQFITHLGFVTGQTAGLAVLVSYVSGFSLGAVFFVVNLPFWVLAWIRMGPRFTIKSIIAVGILSVMTEFLPATFAIAHLSAPVGAAFSGALVGLGLIVLFRHGASLGGIGVLALFLQERFKIQAGWTQLAFDAILFTVALFFLEWQLVGWSLLGAVVVNLIVA
ncbi:MAG: YitT family protein, partial [Boseongicola sp.]|nr:YitT family protein [Boseongicola sp.]